MSAPSENSFFVSLRRRCRKARSVLRRWYDRASDICLYYCSFLHAEAAVQSLKVLAATYSASKVMAQPVGWTILAALLTYITHLVGPYIDRARQRYGPDSGRQTVLPVYEPPVAHQGPMSSTSSRTPFRIVIYSMPSFDNA